MRCHVRHHAARADAQGRGDEACAARGAARDGPHAAGACPRRGLRANAPRHKLPPLATLLAARASAGRPPHVGALIPAPAAPRCRQPACKLHAPSGNPAGAGAHPREGAAWLAAGGRELDAVFSAQWPPCAGRTHGQAAPLLTRRRAMLHGAQWGPERAKAPSCSRRGGLQLSSPYFFAPCPSAVCSPGWRAWVPLRCPAPLAPGQPVRGRCALWAAVIVAFLTPRLPRRPLRARRFHFLRRLLSSASLR